MTKTNKTDAPKTQENIKYDYDAIIIGTGPGGEGAAMGLVKQGLNVAIIERHSAVGGGCTHWGTIPSKALRESVSKLIDYNSNPLFSDNGRHKHFTFPKILKHAEGVIRQQTQLRSGFYERNRVNLIQGEASFINKNTINVAQKDGSSQDLTTKIIVIATGSRPYRPDDVDFNHSRVYDSDTILSLKHDPRNIIIYGAGVIGSEYASIFRGLGVKVDLINTRERLLSFLDNEVSDAISYHLRNSGTVIRNSEEYEHITSTDDGVILQTKSGKRFKADCLLFANGRTGNTNKLNLEAVGLKADKRGQIKIDQHYQTEVDNIYAVGDVIGFPSLASAAYDQGRLVADFIINGEMRSKLIEDIPTGIYTIPEISSVGKTEQELTAARVPYEVGKAQFKHLARAQIADSKIGGLKILFHPDTKEILGIHCFGTAASEIVHIGQAIMQQEGKANTVEYFVNTTFNYPTMAEAYRVAALNGLNRLF